MPVGRHYTDSTPVGNQQDSSNWKQIGDLARKLAEGNKTDPVCTDLLRELLDYDPLTGRLWWRKVEGRMNSRAGMPALINLDKDGYQKGSVARRYVRAHRVAWAIYYGYWPSECVDHVNGNKSDNRISNLRESSKGQNGYNRPATAVNTSGHKGVTFNKSCNKWQAQCRIAGRNHYLGVFPTLEEAAKAYDEFSIKNHAHFSYINGCGA